MVVGSSAFVAAAVEVADRMTVGFGECFARLPGCLGFVDFGNFGYFGNFDCFDCFGCFDRFDLIGFEH